jgi:hypothetical protein
LGPALKAGSQSLCQRHVIEKSMIIVESGLELFALRALRYKFVQCKNAAPCGKVFAGTQLRLMVPLWQG